jgi:hypothetical protein
VPYKYPSLNFPSPDSWLTEDLLKKVTSNPNLSKQLLDPKFMQGIAEFQNNPEAAMAKYQDNPEMQSFIKDFCSILGEISESFCQDLLFSLPSGDHFNRLGDTSAPLKEPHPISTRDCLNQAELSVVKSSDPKQPKAQDEARMQEILANPEVRSILQDPRIQRLFEVLRIDPEKAQKYDYKWNCMIVNCVLLIFFRILQSNDPEMARMIQKLCEAGLLQFQR